MIRALVVYPGLGKTTLAKKNTAFADIEAKPFKDLSLCEYIGKLDYPNVRGQKAKELNPAYPENMYEYARKEIAVGKVLLLTPKQDSYDLLAALGISDFSFIMPDKHRLQQLESDQIKRGDDKEYIRKNLNERYEQVLNFANKLGKEIIFIQPDEYLEQTIKGVK
jgi:hypothetical protein